LGAVPLSDQSDGPFANEVYETGGLRIVLESEYGGWWVNMSFGGGPLAPASYWLEALDGRLDMPVPGSTEEDLPRLTDRLPEVISQAAELAEPVSRMVGQYRRQRAAELEETGVGLMTGADKLDSLIAAVESERRLGQAARVTQAEDSSLDGVLGYLEQAKAKLASGDSDGALQILERAKYHVAESCTYRAELSNAVLSYVSGLVGSRCAQAPMGAESARPGSSDRTLNRPMTEGKWYAGMGSFSDLVLQDSCGVLPAQGALDDLRSRLFEAARSTLGEVEGRP
jgi:hypothetical protein